MKKIDWKKEFDEYVVLLRSIPSVVLALFVVSVILMNLLANKSIDLPVDWLALDCGIIVSWLSFLTMDILVKRFGPKAATEVSVTASFINLICCGLFALGAVIPGSWGESFIEVGGDIANTALNNTFAGTWYVLFGSTVAFLASALINNTINWAIGLRMKHCKDSFKAYAVRSYVSTAIGQFCDNLIFALIVSHNFFGWTMTQCLTCSLTGAIVELLCEVIFSPVGYKVVTNWETDNVGHTYIDYVKE